MDHLDASTHAFSLTSYRGLLTEFQERGYRFVRFTDFDAEAGGRQLILRHDVDMCLERAVRVAKVEAELDARSVFYVMLTSDLYNPATRAGRAALMEMRSIGHEVGLHFDGTVYFDSPDTITDAALNAAVERETRILADLIEAPVKSMSFHRPIPMLQARVGTVGGLIHAYEPRFFKNIGYCSDSEGRWRFGHPLVHEAVAHGAPLQLLTHPVWWALDEATSDTLETLSRLVADRDKRYRKELARNCKPYRDRVDRAPFSTIATEP